jgi:hypothetical protein
MIAYETVVELADQLPLAEKARLIEHLSAALRQKLEVAPAVPSIPSAVRLKRQKV